MAYDCAECGDDKDRHDRRGCTVCACPKFVWIGEDDQE